MASFLEKLKKGMKTDKNSFPAADIDESGETKKQKEEKEEKEYDEEKVDEVENADNSAQDEFKNEENDKNSEEDDIDEKDENEEEEVEEKKPKKTAALRKKTSQKLENLEVKTISMIKETPSENAENEKKEWLDSEGQLAVDVYQTDEELIIQAAIAGIKTEDLDVLIEEEILTIKGKRDNPCRPDAADYFIQECYWGAFSRKLILPVEVDASRCDATMKEGILTIHLPKIQREKKKKITIKG